MQGGITETVNFGCRLDWRAEEKSKRGWRKRRTI